MVMMPPVVVGFHVQLPTVKGPPVTWMEMTPSREMARAIVPLPSLNAPRQEPTGGAASSAWAAPAKPAKLTTTNAAIVAKRFFMETFSFYVEGWLTAGWGAAD